MSIFGASQQTAQITSGNVRTTFDLYATTKPFNNGLTNQLGTLYYDVGNNAAAVVGGGATGVAPGNPLLSGTLYKYVLYKSVTNPALQNAPAVVYYTDETETVVSGTLADGFTATTADAAGIMMPNTTDVSGLTATILNNGGLGSGIWIAVGGFVKLAAVPAATAVGDFLIGAAGNFLLGRIAAGAALTCNPVVAVALTAVAATKSDVRVKLVPVS